MATRLFLPQHVVPSSPLSQEETEYIPVDVSNTIASANRVLQSHRNRLRRRLSHSSNTVNPETNSISDEALISSTLPPAAPPIDHFTVELVEEIEEVPINPVVTMERGVAQHHGRRIAPLDAPPPVVQSVWGGETREGVVETTAPVDVFIDTTSPVPSLEREEERVDTARESVKRKPFLHRVTVVPNNSLSSATDDDLIATPSDLFVSSRPSPSPAPSQHDTLPPSSGALPPSPVTLPPSANTLPPSPVTLPPSPVTLSPSLPPSVSTSSSQITLSVPSHVTVDTKKPHSSTAIGQDQPNTATEKEQIHLTTAAAAAAAAKERESDEEMTEAELMEYHSFLRKLNSSSSGRVISVAPAPSDKRSSYLQHRDSKIGVQNIAMGTGTDSLNENREHPLSSPTSGETRLTGSRLVQPVRIQVLPAELPVERGGAIVTRVAVREKREEMEERMTPMIHTPPTQSNDLILEDAEDWVPPPNEPRPFSSVSRQEFNVKIGDATDELDIGSESMVARNGSESTAATNRSESMLLRNGSESMATRNGSESTNAKNESESMATRNGSESMAARNGSESDAPPTRNTSEFSPRKDKGFKKGNGSKSKTKNGSQSLGSERNGSESTASNGFSTRNGSESTGRTDMILEDVQDSSSDSTHDNVTQPVTPNLPDPLSVAVPVATSLEETDSMEGVVNDVQSESSSGREGNTDHLSSMPLLRVKSTTSLYVPDYVFQSKRERATPAYSLHCHGNRSVLAPACPRYGITQPTENEVASKSLQQLKTSIKIKIPQEKPPSREEKREEREVAPSILSTSSSQSLYSFDKKVEVDLSLHKAVREGNHRQIQSLLSKGYNVNGIDEEGCTPLMHCVLPSGNVQLTCADLLIRKGANIDHQANDGSTVLHGAAIVGSVALLELLLMNGANPDLRDNDGRLPLHWSTAAPSTRALALLLKDSQYHIDVTDSSDMTPLMWACYNKNEAIARELIQMGADIDEKDEDGKTAVHWATRQCDINLLQLMLTSDMTYFKDKTGCTVIHIAASEGFVRGIQHILSLRSDSVHDIDKMGRTPLHYAAAKDRVDICYLLLNRGADATKRDVETKSPLDYALIKENEYVVALFTCHNTSVGDFSKLLRSESLTSLQSRLHDDSIITESISVLGLEEEETVSNSIPSVLRENCIRKGTYLGYFTEDDTIPPLHYFFWIDPKHRKLCWSRSNKRHDRREATVLNVIPEASKMVASRRDYSPKDLHIHVFCVVTKECLLDLLAYSESSFKNWIDALQCISSSNVAEIAPSLVGGGEVVDLFVCSREDGESDKVTGSPPLSSSTPVPAEEGRPSQLYPYDVI